MCCILDVWLIPTSHLQNSGYSYPPQQWGYGQHYYPSWKQLATGRTHHSSLLIRFSWLNCDLCPICASGNRLLWRRQELWFVDVWHSILLCWWTRILSLHHGFYEIKRSPNAERFTNKIVLIIHIKFSVVDI